MYFVISSGEFYGLLSAASKCLMKKNSMPILDDFLIKVSDGIVVTASDGEKFLTLKGSIIEHDKDAEFCIPSNILESIKELAEQPLNVSVHELTNELTITHNNGKYCVMSQDAAVYPKPYESETRQEVTIPSNNLLDAINDTLWATADDEIRIVMTGVYMDMKDQSTVFAATNGKVIARKEFNGNIGNGGVIISKKVCDIVRKVCMRDTEIKMYIGEQQTRMECSNMSIIFRNIEGKFPNYDAVFPYGVGKDAIVDKLGLLGSLKRMSVFCNQSSGLAKYSFDKDSLVIEGQDNDYSTSAIENVGCSYSSEPIAIGFNVTKMKELISIINCENIRMQLFDPTRAACIMPLNEEEGTNTKFLLMPMMI